MAKQSQRTCPICGRKTLHVQAQSIGDGFGCLLMILTAGLFLPVWFVLILIDALSQPWRCQTCGQSN